MNDVPGIGPALPMLSHCGRDTFMNTNRIRRLSAEMTVLDVVSNHPETEAVFRSYDVHAGECICCRMLFETVHDVAQHYGLDLSEMMRRLNDRIKE